MAIVELVRNILDTRFDALSDERVDDAKNRMIDIVGCAIAGANASGNSIVLDLIRGWGGSKEATILVHGDKVPAHNAAVMNSIMARSFDYEATGPSPEGEVADRTVGHNCCTTDPAALSVAELKGSNGKEIITSIILGGDIAVRISVAGDPGMSRGFDVTGTASTMGATAVAGRLWGLDENQMVNAFGIVVDTIAGSFQGIMDGVHAFKLHGALSARNAIVAVELASKGFTGIKDPLESPAGYYTLYSKMAYPEHLTRDLGKVFHAKGRHKIHPSCYGNHSTIDAGLDVLRQRDIDIEDIAEVTLGVTPGSARSNLAQPFEAGDSQQKALFSMRYSLANILMRKEARIEHYTDEYIQDPKVIDLTRNIKLEPSVQSENRNTVEVTVKLKNGEVITGHAEKQRGYLDNPLTKEEIIDKFWKCVDFSKTVSRQNAEKALAMLENLEEIDKISRIVDLLVV